MCQDVESGCHNYLAVDLTNRFFVAKFATKLVGLKFASGYRRKFVLETTGKDAIAILLGQGHLPPWKISKPRWENNRRSVLIRQSAVATLKRLAIDRASQRRC